MILISSSREFVIEDSVVQRDLPKIWSLCHIFIFFIFSSFKEGCPSTR